MVDYHEEILKLQKQQEALLQLIKDSGISVSFEASDIKIGAVEIQDKSDDLRVDVEAISTGMTAGNNSLLVKAQICDASGNIIDPAVGTVIKDVDNTTSFVAEPIDISAVASENQEISGILINFDNDVNIELEIDYYSEDLAVEYPLYKDTPNGKNVVILLTLAMQKDCEIRIKSTDNFTGTAKTTLLYSPRM